jgi:membrane magnesium transporter 1
VDVTVELLVALSITCMGIVLASPQLRPIQWSVWAGKVEREGRKPKSWEEGLGNPFRGLDERVGFLDIRVCTR